MSPKKPYVCEHPIVNWREGIRETPNYTAYVYEVWVDSVLWYWSNVKADTYDFYVMMVMLMADEAE